MLIPIPSTALSILSSLATAFANTSTIQCCHRLRHRIQRPSDRRCSDHIMPAYVATSMLSPHNSIHPCFSPLVIFSSYFRVRYFPRQLRRKLQGYTLARAGQPHHSSRLLCKASVAGAGRPGYLGCRFCQRYAPKQSCFVFMCDPNPFVPLPLMLVLPLVKTVGVFGGTFALARAVTWIVALLVAAPGLT